MIGGPPPPDSGGDDDGGGGGGGDGDATPARLPSSDPTCNNYCGSDWNNALANCDSPDHWCPNGADEDCPDNKVCYAGTDYCRYIANLFPTLTPTDEPTLMPTTGFPTTPPTSSPVIYNTAENIRFYGEGWEDVRNTCRMGSHCSSGDDAVCSGTQASLLISGSIGWRRGMKYLVLIIGHCPRGGWRVRWMWTLDTADGSERPKPKPVAQLPPVEILDGIGISTPAQYPGESQLIHRCPNHRQNFQKHNFHHLLQ